MHLDNILPMLRKDFKIKGASELAQEGRNASVYQLTSERGARFALKLYKSPCIATRKEKYEREIYFLRWLDANKIGNIPKLVAHDSASHWCLMTWIEGERIKSLSDSNIRQIASFLRRINPAGFHIANKNYKHRASEPITSAEEFTQTIYTRCVFLKNLDHKEDQLTEEIQNWIKKELFPATIREAEKLADHAKENHWNHENIGMYLSPSDVGLHNTILHKGQLYFMDFEHAGKDDLSKTIADWTLQPEYTFSANLTSTFLNAILENFQSDGWLERYHQIRPLIRLKWILIMLRDYKENRIKEDQWRKVMNYYEVTQPSHT